MRSWWSPSSPFPPMRASPLLGWMQEDSCRTPDSPVWKHHPNLDNENRKPPSTIKTFSTNLSMSEITIPNHPLRSFLHFTKRTQKPFRRRNSVRIVTRSAGLRPGCISHGCRAHKKPRSSAVPHHCPPLNLWISCYHNKSMYQLKKSINKLICIKIKPTTQLDLTHNAIQFCKVVLLTQAQRSKGEDKIVQTRGESKDDERFILLHMGSDYSRNTCRLLIAISCQRHNRTYMSSRSCSLMKPSQLICTPKSKIFFNSYLGST